MDKFKGITDKNLRLVVLAKITDELLGEHKESQKTDNNNTELKKLEKAQQQSLSNI